MKYLAFLLLLLTACEGPGTNPPARHLNFDAFGSYWYQGKAEINTYALEQFRYGEKREAEAVIIFVTKDISREKQEKQWYRARLVRGAKHVLE